MRLHPHERFLGVPAGATARELLGIDAGVVLDGPMIEQAVRARLSMIDRHPGGASADAERVRQAVRAAAEALKGDIGKAPEVATSPAASTRASHGPRSSSAHHGHARQRRMFAGAPRATRGQRPGITLTDFDRQVLGTLVGAGGWNRESRSRLVAIAAAHRVTVHGLLTVIRGLNDYARQGGARLDVATITAGRRTLAPATAAAARPATPSLPERLLPDLKEPTPATTVKWSFIFGLAALVLGAALIVAVLMSGGRHRTATPPAPPPPVVVDQPQAPAPDDALAISREPAKFPQPPTFAIPLADIIPADALAESAKLPELLDHVVRRVRVADEPSEAVYRDWAAHIDLASRTWPAVEASLRESMATGVRRVFEEADAKQGVSDRLLAAFAVADSSITDPIAIAQRAWRIERLVELSQSLALSPAVRDRALAMVRAALPKDVDPRTTLPAECAAQWLASLPDSLAADVDHGTDNTASWEVWLASLKITADSDTLQSMLAQAIEALLRGSADFTQPGLAVNVLGRLASELDWNQPLLRDHVSGWFDDPAAITGDDLWVLTSIVSEQHLAPWFTPSLIVPRGADEAHRRRMRDQIASAWPHDATGDDRAAAAVGRGIDVDPEIGKAWRRAQASLMSASVVADPPLLAQHLALVARLNEAASLLERGDATAAGRVIEWIEHVQAAESLASGEPALSSPRGPARYAGKQPGQAIGQDGLWAAAYAQAGSAADARINLLRALRNTAGTDLGPIDAAVFVREVYRATPAEVRTMAQGVAIMFTDGPNVALQLLDQLPDAVANDDTSEFLQRFIGTSLPPVRSEQWRIAARRMLIAHALELMPLTEADVDHAADIISDAVARQGPTADDALMQQVSRMSPADAAEMIRKAWADSLRGVVASEPVPGDLATLERRHRMRRMLVKGPIQAYVANRIGHLDLFAFAVAAEQPALRVTVAELLDQSATNRARLANALQQAIEVETTIAKLHALRMRDRSGEPAEKSP